MTDDGRRGSAPGDGLRDADQGRGRADRARMRVRNLRRRLGASERPGTEPVVVDDLISPLRYDILVRQRYFEFLREHRELAAGDLAPLAEASRTHAYFVWFSRVVVPRFQPELVGQPELIARAFTKRVAASVDLLRSFEAHGLDPARPLVLETGRTIEPTATGKQLARRLYPGDGCHRLALLRASGITELEPGSYRVRSVRRFTPLDNTALLLGELEIDPVTYRRFLALSYGPLVEAALDGGETAPGDAPEGALDEVRRVMRLDAPLLKG
jgi:hypothetical protein